MQRLKSASHSPRVSHDPFLIPVYVERITSILTGFGQISSTVILSRTRLMARSNLKSGFLLIHLRDSVSIRQRANELSLVLLWSTSSTRYQVQVLSFLENRVGKCRYFLHHYGLKSRERLALTPSMWPFLCLVNKEKKNKKSHDDWPKLVFTVTLFLQSCTAFQEMLAALPNVLIMDHPGRGKYR